MSSIESVTVPPINIVRQTRESSRRLVRELGFMRNTLADSDLAPSAVHAILEIGETPGISAKDLGLLLRLDKSNTSRQVARLESDGLVERRPSVGDARSSELFLTLAGRQRKQKIDRFASSQVKSALEHLSDSDQLELVRSLALYANALRQENVANAISEEAPITSISEGYRPGCVGDIASLHARFYAEHWGFGAFFEKRVASELAAFADALPSKGKALWLYVEDGRTLASLAIDGDLETKVAHLRWFIVDEALRGAGIGKRLMTHAMTFVDRYFAETYLATFKGLDAARHLYETFGFKLCEETEGTQWGTKVSEQRFVRRAD